MATAIDPKAHPDPFSTILPKGGGSAGAPGEIADSPAGPPRESVEKGVSPIEKRPLVQRAMLQLKDYKSLRSRGVAPFSHTGSVALAIAGDLFEKEDGGDTLPTLTKAKAPAPEPGKDFGSKRLASTVIQNEPSIDGPASNPKVVIGAFNDYRDTVNPENEGIHAYLNIDFDVEDFNSVPVGVPVKVNDPDLYSKKAGGQGDSIVLSDPKHPNIVYFLYMAFNMGDENINSLQLSTFNLDKLDERTGRTGQLGTFTVVGHKGPNPDGTPANFEDKNNMAIDPESGTIMVTNTQFAGDKSGSRINAYFLKPRTDSHGIPTGDFEFVNHTGEPFLVSGKSVEVQWSQPGFLPGSVPLVAYRSFTDDGRSLSNQIYASSRGKEGKFKPVVAAKIDSPVEDYFGEKFDRKFGTQFRSLSAPSMATNSKDGSAYIVYEDAEGGQSRTYLVKSADGGKTWSDPAPIAETKRDHWMSAVNVDSTTGAVAVGFLGIDDKGNYAPMVTLSLDGGRHWTTPETVDRDSNFMLDRFNGEFSGDYTSVKVRSEKTPRGETVFHVHYAHPTAYGTDDPTVRVSRPLVTRMSYPTSLVESVYAASKDGHPGKTAGTDWSLERFKELMDILETINGKKEAA